MKAKKIEERRLAALIKSRTLREAWKNGNPGEPNSVERSVLVSLSREGRWELTSINREIRKIESLKKLKLIKKWLKGIPKSQLDQILIWLRLNKI